MKQAVVLWTVLAASVAWSACGGDGATGPGPGEEESEFFMRARIDGAEWSASSAALSGGVQLTLPGLYSLVGVEIGGGPTMVISLYNIAGPGTYPLGVGGTVPGGSVLMSTATASWSTPLSGAAGRITITALTSSRIAGTFEATLAAFTGSATGTRTIAGGAFDLEVRPTGEVGPLPDHAGSTVGASVNGSAWNAAAVASSYTSGILAIAATNDQRAVTIAIAGLTGPGTYPLSATVPVRTIGVTGVTSPPMAWSSSTAGGGGAVTITSLTATRVRGTFTATLGPAPGTATTGTVTIANGTFDVGLPQRP